MRPWAPELPLQGGPIYERLLARLEADIGAGVLKAGARLPAQRDLAYRLGLSIGTVTRAYAEAERRGLITGQVGRGSFVSAAAGPTVSNGPIDLARNLPPLAPAGQRFAAAVARIARRGDLAAQLDYPPPGGFEDQRRAAAAWAGRTANFPSLDWRRVIVCAGAQQAVALALGAICGPGDAVIAEEATFSGLKALAAYARYRLVPAAMDREGLTPEALDRAAAETGARAAYVLPVQNPTGRVMGAKRRRAIVEVARRRDLILVEDDLYGAHAADLGHPPLAELAPERVCYVGGLSKSVAPGLRFGYLAPPAGDLFERALDVQRAIAFGGPTLAGLVAAQWIEGGEAFAILEAVRNTCAERAVLARRILGEALEPGVMRSAPHLWAPMGELAAEQVAGRALRAGVQVTPPRAPFLDGTAVSGLRLCLGGARDLAELERGFSVVKQALGSADADGRHGV